MYENNTFSTYITKASSTKKRIPIPKLTTLYGDNQNAHQRMNPRKQNNAPSMRQ